MKNWLREKGAKFYIVVDEGGENKRGFIFCKNISQVIPDEGVLGRISMQIKNIFMKRKYAEVRRNLGVKLRKIRVGKNPGNHYSLFSEPARQSSRFHEIKSDKKPTTGKR